MRRTHLLKIALLSVALGLAGRGLAEEPVRAELVRLQEQTGLTLASFYRNAQIVKFADRRASREAVFHPGGTPEEGNLSHDGVWIAMDVAAEKREYLAVGRRDGSSFRQYPDIAGPYNICWSFDRSALALMSGGLLKLDLASGVARKIDESGYLTSQCWSPSGKQLVYGSAGGGIRVYDLDKGESREVARGKGPTWSPDGQWIAFLDGDAFYAIRPCGEDKKLLFKVTDARSPLWWSPDSRFVAYVGSATRSFWESLRSPSAALQLRVRRLADNSEDYVLELADKGYVPSFQWIQPAGLQGSLGPDLNSASPAKGARRPR